MSTQRATIGMVRGWGSALDDDWADEEYVEDSVEFTGGGETKKGKRVDWRFIADVLSSGGMSLLYSKRP